MIDGLYLREGIDYFNGEGQRQAVFNELMSWFKFKVAKAHHGVMTNPTASTETKTMSERLKAYVFRFFLINLRIPVSTLSALYFF